MLQRILWLNGREEYVLQGTKILLTDRKKETAVAFLRSISLELRTRTEPVRVDMYEGDANAVKRKIEQAGLVIDLKIPV
jgi:hypothetical protein